MAGARGEPALTEPSESCCSSAMGRVKCQFSEMIQHLEEGSSQILAFLDIQRFPTLFFFNMFSTCCLLKAGF